MTLVHGDPYRLGTQKSATASILDDEKPVVSIRAIRSSASELEASSGAFTISRIGRLTGKLTVNHIVSGTATPGKDYHAPSGYAVLPSEGPFP